MPMLRPGFSGSCFARANFSSRKIGTAPLMVALGLALALLPACTSSDTIAANYAADAQTAFDQGRIPDAMVAIKKAIAARDDVVDYWLLMAHIDLKADNRDGAFSDYQYAVQLDHGNLEALQGLCELGLSVNQPDTVDRYADQLLLLTPGAAAPLIAKGSAALARGDKAAAQAFADRVLAQDPQNMGALILKARVLVAGGNYADGAALIENAQASPGSLVSKLEFLKDAYVQAHNRPAFAATVKQLADAAPADVDAQFAYADLLYQNGANEQARNLVRTTMAAHPADFHVAAQALVVWMKAGAQALDAATMVAEAANLSPLMKADFAQYANEMGHPELAIAIVHGADQGEPTKDNANAKAALAYAFGLTGHLSQAMTQLNDILDDDPDQPWALLARARLLARTHDYVNAIRDARLVVVNDPKNATARLALVDILQASGAADLSESALREGSRAIPDDVRLAARLAATLTAHGEAGQAAAVARGLFRAASMDQRAQRLLEQYDKAAAGALPS